MKWLTLILLVLISACARTIPPMPDYNTVSEIECGENCQIEYAECMELDIRPDYLIISPRKAACKKQLNECYLDCRENKE